MAKILWVTRSTKPFILFSVSVNIAGSSQVLDAIEPVMNKGSIMEQTIYRAKFSSITDTDICNAMNCLGEPNRNEAQAVDARQELDLRIGCAFTRYISVYNYNLVLLGSHNASDFPWVTVMVLRG